MSASEKAAHLKSLAEGIDRESPEGKLMLAMIELIESMAKDIEDLENTIAELSDYIENIREDIEYVEDLALGNEGDADFECDELQGGCSGNCSTCGGCPTAEYEATCPACGKVFDVFKEDIEFGSILCPACGQELEFDGEEDE